MKTMSLSRRTFLKKTGAVMAGAALAPVSLLTAHADEVDEVSEEETPAFIYYYDPTMEPAKIDLRPGSVNYLVYDREQLVPVTPGTQLPQIAYVENPYV